jgi:hypothetical protein
VNTVPDAANLEVRCKGVADGIAKHDGNSNQLPLPGIRWLENCVRRRMAGSV